MNLEIVLEVILRLTQVLNISKGDHKKSKIVEKVHKGEGHTGLWSIGRWHFSPKCGNFIMGSKSQCLMVLTIHDSPGTISNIFVSYLRDFLLKREIH